MSLKNYYQILGASRDTDAEDIKKAFRELALRFHPDRNAGNSEEAEERFKEINEAYEVLGDEQKRQYYNHLIGWADYRRETIVVEDIFRNCAEDMVRSKVEKILKKFPPDTKGQD